MGTIIIPAEIIIQERTDRIGSPIQVGIIFRPKKNDTDKDYSFAHLLFFENGKFYFDSWSGEKTSDLETTIPAALSEALSGGLTDMFELFWPEALNCPDNFDQFNK